MLDRYARALALEFGAIGLTVAVGETKTAILCPAGADGVPPACAWIRENATVVSHLRGLGIPCHAADATRDTAVAAVAAALDEVVSRVRAIARLRSAQHIITALRTAGGWPCARFLLVGLPPHLLPADNGLRVATADVWVLSQALAHHGDRLSLGDSQAGGEAHDALLQITQPKARMGMGIRLVTVVIGAARDATFQRSTSGVRQKKHLVEQTERQARRCSLFPPMVLHKLSQSLLEGRLIFFG